MESEVTLPEVKPRWYQNPDWLFPLLLVLLGALFFADLLFSTKNVYFRDVQNFHHPLRKVMIDSYARGEFPLWNPFVYMGQPMLADPNYMAFYPTNLLNLVLPFAYAFKLHMVLHVILAGLGIYFLQRRLGIQALPSLAGSIAYQFSGVVLSFLNLFSIVQSIALLPWIGWAFLGCLQQSRITRILGFGGLLALQVTTMEPIMLQCVAWLMGVVTVVHLLGASDKWRAARAILKTILIGTLFAAGLSAVQILPSLELLRLSVRGKGYEPNVLNYWSMHPVDLINLMIPNLFGSPYSLGWETQWGEGLHSGREGYFVSLFIGSTTLFLGALSFFASRRKLQLLLAATALVGVALALGQHSGLYVWICNWIPVLRNGRYTIKYMLLAALALSILASLGLEAVLSRQSALHRRRLLSISLITPGLILGLAVLLLSVYVASNPPLVEKGLLPWIKLNSLASKDFKGILTQLSQSIRWAGLFTILSTSLVLSGLFWRRTALVGGLLVSVLGAELLAQNARLTPLMSGADFEFASEVDMFLRPHPGGDPKRVYHVDPTSKLSSNRWIWAPNGSMAWFYLFTRRAGLPLNGIRSGVQYSLYPSVDDLTTAESNEIYLASRTLSVDDYLILLGRLNSPVFLTMGIMDSPRVFLWKSFDTASDHKLNVYLLKTDQGRVFFTPDAWWAKSSKEALEKLMDSKFPYHEKVILEGPALPDRPRTGGTGRARLLNYENNRVRCEVESEVDGHLVLLDSFYPGWKATLDGNPVPVQRANYAFRAVAVPPGKHLVEFRYRPAVFYMGLWISVVTSLSGAAIAIAGCPRKCRRRSGPEPHPTRDRF